MNYVAEYRIDLKPTGVSAQDIGQVIDRSLGLRDTSGLSLPGDEFALGVAFDLLQIGAGLDGVARTEHIRDVASAPETVTDADILLRLEPLARSAGDSTRYTSLMIRVTQQGARYVTAASIGQIRAELAGR